MSFNGSGTYVPPAGQPVVPGTVIQSGTFNTFVADIGNTLNNVLPRDGQASMSAPLKIVDGTSSIPGLSFNSEASSGLYRPSSGMVGLVASGVEVMRVNSSGRLLIGSTTDDGTNTVQVTGNLSVTGVIKGNATGISGILPVAQGGTGAASLTGFVYGNGTGAFTAATGAQVATALGTSFVQNGTGIGQLSTNQVKIGWAATAGLRVTVDSSDFGYLAASSTSNLGGGPTTLSGPIVATGGTMNGPFSVAATGQAHDPYGTIAVTNRNDALNYSYYGLTKAGSFGAGFGLLGSAGALGVGGAGFVFGGASGGSTGTINSPFLAFNGGVLAAAGDITAGGTVRASGASGFTSTTYVANARNPIWRFGGSSDAFGLSYFQGTSGLNGDDSIGLHFGTATAAASLFNFGRNGVFTSAGDVNVSGVIYAKASVQQKIALQTGSVTNGYIASDSNYCFRILNSGFGAYTLNLDNNGNLTIPGSFAAGSSVSGTYLTSSGNVNAQGALTCVGSISNTSATGSGGAINNFSSMTLNGSNASNPQIGLNNINAGSKSIRVGSGNSLEVVNSAYSAVIASLSDAGGFVAATITGNTVTATSDERKKENWEPVNDSFVNDLAAIEKVGTFDWVDGSGSSLGIGAQSLQRFLPSAIHTGDDGSLSVNYGSAAMVSAVELAKEVVSLKTQVSALTDLVNKLIKAK